jgi:hypothetical protein
VQEIALA